MESLNNFNATDSVFSLEAEQAVLGSLLMDPACMPQVQVLLSAEDFYLPRLLGKPFDNLCMQHRPPLGR